MGSPTTKSWVPPMITLGYHTVLGAPEKATVMPLPLPLTSASPLLCMHQPQLLSSLIKAITQSLLSSCSQHVFSFTGCQEFKIQRPFTVLAKQSVCCRKPVRSPTHPLLQPQLYPEIANCAFGPEKSQRRQTALMRVFLTPHPQPVLPISKQIVSGNK